MSQRENAVVDECLWAFQHYGFYTFPRVLPRGIPFEWPEIDPDRYCGIVYKANTGAGKFGKSFVRFGLPGLPDLQGWTWSRLTLRNGTRIGVEVKTDSGTLTDNQERHLRLARATGCIAFVARGYQDVEKELKLLGFGRRA